MTSAHPRRTLFGRAAAAPGAEAFADAVSTLLARYVDEVVMPFSLCPFLHQRDNGLGAVGIMLDPEVTVEMARDAILALDTPVCHLVFPLSPLASSPFERFGNKLSESVRASAKEKLVHATFHPALVGGTENAYRLIGLLRQAPDAFIQFVPHGLMKGGTVIGGAEPAEGHAEARFKRLAQPERDEIFARLASLQEARRALADAASTLVSSVHPKHENAEHKN